MPYGTKLFVETSTLLLKMTIPPPQARPNVAKPYSPSLGLPYLNISKKPLFFNFQT
jgi:hypothetical protein